MCSVESSGIYLSRSFLRGKTTLILCTSMLGLIAIIWFILWLIIIIIMSHLYASSAAYLCGNFQLSFCTHAVKYAVFVLFYFLLINIHCILRQLFTNALFHFFFYTWLNVARVLNLKFSCVARSPSFLMLTKL